MPKAKINTPVGSRRKKITGTTVKKGLRMEAVPVKTVAVKTGVAPVKAAATKATPVRRGKVTGRLIASMDLDEMLEASKIVEMGFRGEKIPTVKSPKVQKYVGAVLRLNKRASTKSVAKKMQQDLTVQIVEQNKKTTNAAEAKRLYQALMEEE